MSRTCLTCGQAHPGRTCAGTEPSAQPSTFEPVETPVQVEFDWQPIEPPDLVEAERPAVDEPPPHLVVRQLLNDPGKLIILNCARHGDRVFSMLEQFGHPLERHVIPLDGYKRVELGAVTLNGSNRLEIQAIIDVCRPAGDRLSVPLPQLSDEPTILVLADLQEDGGTFVAWLVEAVHAWASNGTWHEPTFTQLLADVERLRGAA